MPNTLRSLYQAKDSIPQETTTNAVYSVTCKTCDAEYIGETKRAIRIREKEHRDAVRLGVCAKSAVAKHVHSSVVPHEVDWRSLQVLDRAGRKNGAQDSGGFPHLQTETSYEPGHRQEPNVECDPVEFSVGTGKVIWLLGKNFVTVSGMMPTFV